MGFRSQAALTPKWPRLAPAHCPYRNTFNSNLVLIAMIETLDGLRTGFAEAEKKKFGPLWNMQGRVTAGPFAQKDAPKQPGSGNKK